MIIRDSGIRATWATSKPLIRDDEAALTTSMSVALKPPVQVGETRDLKQSAIEFLKPLLNNPRIQRVLGGTAGEELWASAPIAVDLSPEDLTALVGEVPEIQAIHPNRTLQIPPVAEAHTNRIARKLTSNGTGARRVDQDGRRSPGQASGAPGPR
jgi:hypothetical protein